MKKQLVILALAFVAIIMTNVYGQAVHHFDPVPLTCITNDPLNPIAGRAYDYSAVLNPANGTAYWYATKSTTFMTNGARVATEIPADGVNIATGATNYMTSQANAPTTTTTQVTWTSAGLAGVTLANPLFMVVEYKGPTCANNMKVMKILPKIAFTVDITNIEDGAQTTLPYGAAESQCVSNVASSSYDAAADNITIDYGSDTLFFEVVAANFTGSFNPTFRLTGIQGTQTADIDMGVVLGTYPTSAGTGINAAAMPFTSPAQNVTTTATTTDNGVSIYVRVIIHNNGFETLADASVSLAVEATDASANVDVEPSCVVGTGFEDIAQQTINARPAVTPGTPMLPQKP